jgi:hypothetical protein
MSIKNKLRHHWHDFYYAFPLPGKVDLALRCKDVADEVDLGFPSQAPTQVLRLFLHFSLCQACSNYRAFSRWIGDEFKKAAPVETGKLSRFDRRLKEKFSTKT